MTRDYPAPDWRGLCLRMADELDHNRQCLLDDRRLTHPLAEEARAALAAEPAPPAEGAVAELVAWLRDDVDLSPADKRRAANLLEQRHLTPVPVSERLPGPGDLNDKGWCWVLYRGFATWALEPPLGQDGKPTGYTHWLPANALPLPSGEVEQ